MYTQVMQATVKPKRFQQFKDGIADHALPAIRTQPGFIDAVEMYDGNKFLCLIFWRTREDADRYTQELFPRVLARTEPLLSDLVRAEIYRVASDTMHQAEDETLRKAEPASVRKLAIVA